MKRCRLLHLLRMFESHRTVASRYLKQKAICGRMSSSMEARSSFCMALSFRYAMRAFMADLIERDSWKGVGA